jgi:hypothetical protein
MYAAGNGSRKRKRRGRKIRKWANIPQQPL